jgi:DNA-binding response OmpR family regulator
METHGEVLVIEDSRELRHLFKIVLKRSHFGVLEAADGPEGLRLAHEHRPKMILCDVRLGQLSGYEVIGALKENSVTAAIPVIMVSGASDDGKAVKLGAYAFLTKPFSMHHLCATIRKALGQAE